MAISFVLMAKKWKYRDDDDVYDDKL